MRVPNRASGCTRLSRLYEEKGKGETVISRQSVRRRLLDRLVLRPTRHRIDAEGKQRVCLHAHGQTLECFVDPGRHEHEDLDVLVLKFPGTAGRAERSSSFPLAEIPDPAADRALRAELWTWNPPGYGSSTGRATLAAIAEAALQFTTQVAQRAAPATRVLVSGNSLGCAPALYTASRGIFPQNRTGMILRNPPPLVPVVQRIARRYPLGQLIDSVAESVCDSMNIERTIANVFFPTVFLQSELDTLVPPELQRQVHQAHPAVHRVIELYGLEHDGVPQDSHAAAIRAAVRWLWDKTDESR